MKTYNIHINGIVQGVGFRPLVYKLAMALGLEGIVENGQDGVHVYVNGSEAKAAELLSRILMEAPCHSHILEYDIKKIASQHFSGFSIRTVAPEIASRSVQITPDMAMCPECRKELGDPSNRRYRYPFITCTQCGPRYSIIKEIPYERHNTSMQPFRMCNSCLEEYSDVDNRRFFSQTNSCPDCGISLLLHSTKNAGPSLKDTELVIRHSVFLLRQGKILAVKGTGGYLLLTDAKNRDSIQILRARKHRPAKPFALLYLDIEMVAEQFTCSDHERALLLSLAAPIVLLYPKDKASSDLKTDVIAPGLNRLGVRLPSNPLLQLIVSDFGAPLIATSANISGSPIIYRDEDVMEHLSGIADYFLSHNRDIIIPQDDSVMQCTTINRTPIILRRSRGRAPSFLHYQVESEEELLATGALMKSTFTVGVNKNVFLSQFLGNTSGYEAQEMFEKTLTHFLSLYDVHPGTIISDLHPDYFAHQLAQKLHLKYHTALQLVQHHEAHFAAILGEHQLLNTSETILGVIWDGTGLGNDGNIWGGEFFTYQDKQMERASFFKGIPIIAGDKMALEPRISALCVLHETGLDLKGLKTKFSEAEWNNYLRLLETSTISTSSAGRIFDAVASLLGCCDVQSYEGEAALRLQCLAENHVRKHGYEMNPYGTFKIESGTSVSLDEIFRGIHCDLKESKTTEYIAARFHYTLVIMIDQMAQHLSVHRICFSGGVFQNALLVDWIQLRLAGNYELFFHQDLSPNDENISFGQLVYHGCQINASYSSSLESIPKPIYSTT